MGSTCRPRPPVYQHLGHDHAGRPEYAERVSRNNTAMISSEVAALKGKAGLELTGYPRGPVRTPFALLDEVARANSPGCCAALA